MEFFDMHLEKLPFEAIEAGQKDIELRVLDEKRALLRLGDEIIFTMRGDASRRLRAYVVGLLYYPTFAQLLEDISLTHFRQRDKEELLRSLMKRYSTDQERKYGVVGIKLKIRPVVLFPSKKRRKRRTSTKN
jgi:ASC-1-like (ASCH) protein